MLKITKEQYSEQVEANTAFRRSLNDLYNLVISPDITQMLPDGTTKGMSP